MWRYFYEKKKEITCMKICKIIIKKIREREFIFKLIVRISFYCILRLIIKVFKEEEF